MVTSIGGEPARSNSARRGAVRRGFSLIELVIVIVIIGIIAAIALPRMSRGSAGAADSTLAGSLSVLRSAIDLYYTEHQQFPTVADFEDQMTKYSNFAGTSFSETKNTATGIIYGPYLRKVPNIPVGPEKGTNVVNTGTVGTTTGVAWIYNASNGDVKPNVSGNDNSGVAYADY